jgi:hypothetical protein
MRRRKQYSRSRKGVLGSMMSLATILISMSLIAVAVDYSHVVSVRAQLRNAADAAALGGAYEFLKDPTGANCNSVATTIAQDNSADGININDGNDITVVTQTTPTVGKNIGTCSVDLYMKRKHMLSPVFGDTGSTMHVHAKAGGGGYIIKPYQNTLFPLAISLDAVPGNANGNSNSNKTFTPAGPTLLYAIQNNVPYTIYFNSTSLNNAAWTSLEWENNGQAKKTDASWIGDIVAQSLGIQSPQYNSVTVPNPAIGDMIYLTNGVMGQAHLSNLDWS